MWGSVQKARACRRGFVTLDVIWIMILLGLAIVLSIHGIGLVEKRENAGRLERELLVVTKAVEQLAEEFAARRRRGDEVSIEQYAAEHPELAERIRELFPAVMMNGRTAPRRFVCILKWLSPKRRYSLRT